MYTTFRAIYPIFLLISIFLVSGCADLSADKSEKIKRQEQAAEDAHKELERSFGESSSQERTKSLGDSQGPQQSDDEQHELPSWVNSPPQNTEKYLYGVGTAPLQGDPASTLNQAQDHARVELIKRLQVNVSGKTTTRSKRLSENSNSQITRSVMNQVHTEVPETELSHINLIDTYVDKKRDTGYALVSLDRVAAQSDLSHRLQEIDSRLKEIAKTPSKSDRIQELKFLVPALPLLVERRGIIEKLSKLSNEQPKQERPTEVRDLQSRIAQLIDSLKVVLEPEDQVQVELASGLRKALSEQGLHVRERGEGDLILRYSLDLRSREQDGVHFVFSRGRTTVLTAGGTVLNEFQAKAKGGSQDNQLARNRAMDNLAQKMGEKIAGGLLESFQPRKGGL